MIRQKSEPIVAIIDYGMGNLFSVQQACQHAGLDAIITSERQNILTADAVILPGVGAFGYAMNTLRELELISTLKQFADSGKPLLGICLGMQLLMGESLEFGRHIGLELIKGTVVHLHSLQPDHIYQMKVPHIGWNRICANSTNTITDSIDISWNETLLEGVCNNSYMYFVHSYVIQPEQADIIIAMTQYGDIRFPSVIRHRNIYAFQGHPERSGKNGLQVYHNLATMLYRKSEDA